MASERERRDEKRGESAEISQLSLCTVLYCTVWGDVREKLHNFAASRYPTDARFSLAQYSDQLHIS
jgi:hypothetical protein